MFNFTQLSFILLVLWSLMFSDTHRHTNITSDIIYLNFFSILVPSLGFLCGPKLGTD